MTVTASPESTAAMRALESRRLARFDGGAIHEVEQFYLAQEQSFSDVDPAVFSLAMMFTHLSAAEFALMPVLMDDTDPDQLPPESPVTVTSGHARLALVKADCTLTFPVHKRDPVGLSDVMVFGGDISKSRLHTLDNPDPLDGPAELYRFVESLVELHAQSPTSSVRALGSVSTLRVQGVLWRAKLAVMEHPRFLADVDAAISEAMDALGLSSAI